MFRYQEIRQFLCWAVLVLVVSLAVTVHEVKRLDVFNDLRRTPTGQRLPVQPPLPAVGTPTQFGVYIDGGQMAHDANTSVGAGNLAIVGIFEHWKASGISSANKLHSICSGGFTPLISWEAWEGRNSQVVYELRDIANGKHDSLILNYFNQLREICGETRIIIRLNHEMEMRPTYGYAWAPWQGKPLEYVQAWRHVIQLAKANDFNNLKWLWSPNRADEYVYDYYPGDEFVDYVGMTLNHPTVTGTVYGSFEQFYAPNRAVLESFGKPIIIGEAAYYHFDEQRIAAWFDNAFAYARQDEKIVALVWFNHGMSHLNYSIEATQAGREAFVRNMKVTD